MSDVPSSSHPLWGVNSAERLSFSVPLIWRLLRQEMRGEWRAFIVFLFCIVLGVGAITSVDVLVGSLSRTITDDARELLGGDFELKRYYRAMDEDQLTWLRDQPDVTIAQIVEIRAMASSITGDTREPVRIEYVDRFFPLYGDLVLQHERSIDQALGQGEDGLPSVIVPPELLILLEVADGDVVALGDQRYRIGGVIENRPDVGFGFFQLGHPVLAAMNDLPNAFATQSLAEYNYRVAYTGDSDPSELLDSFKIAFPEALSSWRVRTSANASDNLVNNVRLLSHFMTLIGLVSLLLGGVGIANSVRLFLTSRAHAIAILRVQGASISLVSTLYQTYVALVALIGIVLGIALAYVVALMAAPILASTLLSSFEVTFAWRSVWLVGGYGMLIVAVFSLIPLSSACHQPITQLLRQQNGLTNAAAKTMPSRATVIATIVLAILLGVFAVVLAPDARFAAWFVVGALVCYGLFGIVSRLISLGSLMVVPRVGDGSPLWALVLKNIGRPGAITSMVMITLGLGITALVMIAQMEHVIVDNAMVHERDRTPTLFAVGIPPDGLQKVQTILENEQSILFSELHPTTRARITHLNGVSSEQIRAENRTREDWVLAHDRMISWSADPLDQFEQDVVAGQWWSKDYRGAPLISVEEDIAEAYNLSIGDTVTWNIAGVELDSTIANIRSINWGTMEIDFAFLFSAGLISGAPTSYLASIGAPDERTDGLYRLLTDAVPDASVIAVRDVVARVSGLVDKMVLAIRVMALFVLAVGVVVLSGVVVVTYERRLVFAIVLRVLGATRRQIMATLLGEYLLLGLACAIVAAVIGTAATWALTIFLLELNWSWDPVSTIQSVSLALVVSVVLGAGSLWFLLNEKPSTRLRND